MVVFLPRNRLNTSVRSIACMVARSNSKHWTAVSVVLTLPDVDENANEIRRKKRRRNIKKRDRMKRMEKGKIPRKFGGVVTISSSSCAPKINSDFKTWCNLRVQCFPGKARSIRFLELGLLGYYGIVYRLRRSRRKGGCLPQCRKLDDE